MDFRIYTRTDGGEWTTSGIGAESENWFATESDALATIKTLKSYGDDWVNAEYEVREESR